ncbi:hypothetical protein [Gephyromycinifex aptenodytis]|uniref:hypothetical protein n=1 Tax=Gephyromycinifex aptenodytis TaxID=2716227 RepID=UPI0014489E83|nr:hypothetical protein [Gephyromycinifex aptenodytis]
MKSIRVRTIVLRSLGVAGMAGLVAGGVAVARGERRRRTMTPEEIRTRLQERYAQIEAEQV